MIHKVIISWDDEELDEAPTWEDFVREYILDEMHGFIDDMDLSMKTINHAHDVLDKIMCHLNRYVEAEREENGTDVVNTTFTDKDAHFGEVVLRVIRDVDTPMLMYEGEKEAVKKALIMALDKWAERKE